MDHIINDIPEEYNPVQFHYMIHKLSKPLMCAFIRMSITLCYTIYVTGPDKAGLIALFCISRNTNSNIKCTVLLWWLDTVTPDILYNKCSYIAIIS